MASKVVPFARKIDLAHATLADARHYPGCVVMLGCEVCGWMKGYDPLRIANRLWTRGDGGLSTPVATVARHVRALCPHCKGKHWSTQFAYPAHMRALEAERRARTQKARPSGEGGAG